MKVYDNPLNCLTNNPPFPFHLYNFSQYEKLSPDYGGSFNPFGLGFGGIGLPGDFSPASRFVKTAFLLKNSAAKNVNQLFHILDAAAIPKGAVVTTENKLHYTTYQCCFFAESLTFVIRCYDDLNVKTVRLTAENMNGKKLISDEQF